MCKSSAPVTSSFTSVVLSCECNSSFCCTCHLPPAFVSYLQLSEQQWQATLLCRFKNSSPHWKALVCQKFCKFVLECISKVSNSFFFLLVGNSTDIVWVQGLNNQELSHEIRLDSIVSGCLNKCKSFANLYVSMFSSVTSRSLVTVAKYDSQEFVAVLNSCPWVSRGKKISQKQL